MGAKKQNLYCFFLRKKPVMILINLAKNNKLRYASVLAKEVDCTYSHTVKIIQMMNDNGIVEFDKKGRLKSIKLTPLGEEIAANLTKTVSLFHKAEKL